jgi:hypothetical protein
MEYSFIRANTSRAVKKATNEYRSKIQINITYLKKITQYSGTCPSHSFQDFIRHINKAANTRNIKERMNIELSTSIIFDFRHGYQLHIALTICGIEAKSKILNE